MFENLYDNIGDKVKNLAKCAFIVEAIGFLIAGLVTIFSDDDLILLGLLIVLFGPIIAWVSSWVLYAFGQLVDDVGTIRQKNNAEGKDIEPLLKDGRKNTTAAPMAATIQDGKKVCPKCGIIQALEKTKCWSCGQPFSN